MSEGIRTVLEEIRDCLRVIKKGYFEDSLVGPVSVTDRKMQMGGKPDLRPIIQFIVRDSVMNDIGGGIRGVRITSHGIALVEYKDGGRGVYPSDSGWRLAVDWVEVNS